MHTPGPWRVNGFTIEADSRELNRDGIPYIDVIAHIYDNYLSSSEAESNARLVATAPELLEACEKAADYLLGIGLDTDEDGEPSPEYTRLILAIAKARGKE